MLSKKKKESLYCMLYLKPIYPQILFFLSPILLRFKEPPTHIHQLLHLPILPLKKTLIPQFTRSQEIVHLSLPIVKSNTIWTNLTRKNIWTSKSLRVTYQILTLCRMAFRSLFSLFDVPLLSSNSSTTFGGSTIF